MISSGRMRGFGFGSGCFFAEDLGSGSPNSSLKILTLSKELFATKTEDSFRSDKNTFHSLTFSYYGEQNFIQFAIKRIDDDCFVLSVGVDSFGATYVQSGLRYEARQTLDILNRIMVLNIDQGNKLRSTYETATCCQNLLERFSRMAKDLADSKSQEDDVKKSLIIINDLFSSMFFELKNVATLVQKNPVVERSSYDPRLYAQRAVHESQQNSSSCKLLPMFLFAMSFGALCLWLYQNVKFYPESTPRPSL